MRTGSRELAVVLLAVVTGAGCAGGAGGARGESRPETATRRPEAGAPSDALVRDLEPACSDAADEAMLACARIGAFRGAGGRCDVEALATEGGHARVFRPGPRFAMIRGGLLFESRRLAFDYRFRDGVLLCASEELSNVQVIEEQRGHPAWEPYWHTQRLVFRDGSMIGRVEDYTRTGAGAGRAPETIRAFAASLLERADASP